jgi:chromosome partitioning protein
MHREVRNYIDKFDVIFIDCPPAMNSAAPTSAMLISDLALIPVVPSPGDIWAAEAAKKLAAAASVTNESLIARVVANMVQKQLHLLVICEVLGEDEECPMLNSQLGSRSAFRECQILGTTVHFIPRAGAAIKEVDSMTDEVLGIPNLVNAKNWGKLRWLQNLIEKN